MTTMVGVAEGCTVEDPLAVALTLDWHGQAFEYHTYSTAEIKTAIVGISDMLNEVTRGNVLMTIVCWNGGWRMVDG